MSKRTKVGLALEEGLHEALVWKRGEIEHKTRTLEPMPPTRVKAIRKGVARSPREFERRFDTPPEEQSAI